MRLEPRVKKLEKVTGNKEDGVDKIRSLFVKLKEMDNSIDIEESVKSIIESGHSTLKSYIDSFDGENRCLPCED